jgi:hypothetical protein
VAAGGPNARIDVQQTVDPLFSITFSVRSLKNTFVESRCMGGHFGRLHAPAGCWQASGGGFRAMLKAAASLPHSKSRGPLFSITFSVRSLKKDPTPIVATAIWAILSRL